MQLEHSFSVPVGIDEAWEALLDLERIAPCMPGAAITGVEGEDYSGTVKVKLGAIGLTYKGIARFVERDAAAHRAVIDARGRDARGGGSAAAKVTARLSGDGGSTRVDVTTDLDITGKPAQFGRGVMVDVGNKLIGQFASSLAVQLQAPAAGAAPEATPEARLRSAPPASPAPAAPAAPLASAHLASGPATTDDAIDLLRAAGPAVLTRLVPVLVGLVMLVVGIRVGRSTR